MITLWQLAAWNGIDWNEKRCLLEDNKRQSTANNSEVSTLKKKERSQSHFTLYHVTDHVHNFNNSNPIRKIYNTVMVTNANTSIHQSIYPTDSVCPQTKAMKQENTWSSPSLAKVSWMFFLSFRFINLCTYLWEGARPNTCRSALS